MTSPCSRCRSVDSRPSVTDDGIDYRCRADDRRGTMDDSARTPAFSWSSVWTGSRGWTGLERRGRKMEGHIGIDLPGLRSVRGGIAKHGGVVRPADRAGLTAGPSVSRGLRRATGLGAGLEEDWECASWEYRRRG